jgi:hypothetical protein
MHTLLMATGIIVAALGLLFVGQGSGFVRWPRKSFMISDAKWIYYGGGIAILGILLAIVAGL